MGEVLSDDQLRVELEPEIGRLLDHHMDVVADRQWGAHLYVPWSDAQDYDRDNPADPNPLGLSKEVQSALIINGLTEDNLPYYTTYLLAQAGKSPALREWVGQWTSEENDHQYLIRAWIEATGAVDPAMLNAARTQQMRSGIVPQPEGLAAAAVYTSLQELSTNLAHRNTGRKLGKEHRGAQAMAIIAGDEMNHHNFYEGIVREGLRIDASRFVLAAAWEISHFEMPGTGIPDFRRHAARVALSGVYGTNEFVYGVVQPTLDKWGFWDIEDGLSDEAKTARDELVVTLDDYRAKATKETERRVAYQKRQDAAA